MSEEIEVSGYVEKIIFVNPVNGFHILSVILKEVKGASTVKITKLNIQKGLTLKFTGQWIDNPKYDKPDFKASKAEEIKPESFEGIVAWISSDYFNGIGPVIASRIVEHFGVDNIFDIFDNHIERLLEIRGITKKKLAGIKQSWEENKHMNSIMVFLQDHGITTLFAVKIYNTYGVDCINIIKDNPYILASDIEGIGFAYADKLAMDLGIPRDSEKRVEAGIKFVLSKSEHDGHCFLKLNQIIKESFDLLKISKKDLIVSCLHKLEVEDEIRVVSLYINDEKRYYTKKIFCNEDYCVKKIKTILSNVVDFDQDNLDHWAKSNGSGNIILSDEQLNAVKGIITNPVSILTGGAGVGKTACTHALVKYLESINKRILLAAPTGRAAKRMTEVIGRESLTIHRLLAWNPFEERFTFDEKNPLTCDFIIVDESSMIDINLASSFLKAVPVGCQLLFIGDANQLPPVGAGMFFRDLIDSQKVQAYKLTKIYRQGNGSDIIRYAHEINEGNLPEIQSPMITPGLWKEGTDCLFIESGMSDPYMSRKDYPVHHTLRYDLDFIDMVKKLYVETVPKFLGTNKEIQILCPMNKGDMGTVKINDIIQEAINPPALHKQEITVRDRIFRVGDRVIQKVNNYDLSVFNGDIGKVSYVDRVKAEAIILFGPEERPVEYKRENLLQIDLAYAVSVHKSQGSEFDVVIVCMMPNYSVMLQKNLLYTAVTRGKKMVVIVGTRKAMQTAVKNVSTNLRQTSLKELLIGDESLVLN